MITRTHYLKLKQILNSNGTEAKDYNKNKELYDFLCAEKYIKKSNVRNYNGYTVTEFGKVQIKLYKDDTRRFGITTFISSVALITSIVSILLQSEAVQELLLQLLE